MERDPALSGLAHPNVKSTYAFSDFPFPNYVPQWPSGEQVQDYLAAYVERFGLEHRLRLGTEVVAAQLDETAGQWTLHISDGASGARATERFDHLVIANGVFSEPHLPAFAGAAEYLAAGGRIVHTTQLRDQEATRGRHVLVLGYGKSACDVAEAVSGAAATTTVIARRLLWKLPRRILGVLNHKYLVLTRLGEALFRHPDARGLQRALHAGRMPPARLMLATLQLAATRQHRLPRLGLVPPGSFEEIARSTISLTTDRFYAKVRRGDIAVRRDTEIARLLVDNAGHPAAELTDGARLPADLVVCGTGFRQRIPFLSEDVHRRLTDERGNFALYRHVLAPDVPRLTFAGYNSSLFSPLSAEIAALWTAGLLAGAITLPTVEQMRAHARTRLAWMDRRTNGKHARGANIIPFSMRNIDELLSDMQLDVSRALLTHPRLRRCRSRSVRVGVGLERSPARRPHGCSVVGCQAVQRAGLSWWSWAQHPDVGCGRSVEPVWRRRGDVGAVHRSAAPAWWSGVDLQRLV